MKKIKIIALAIMFLTACQKDNSENGPASTEQSGSTSGINKERVTRALEINLTSTAVTDPAIPPTTCSGDLQGFAIGDLILQGSGSHIGLINPLQSTLHHVNCNLSFTTALLTASVAGQITAANGDRIYYTGDDDINVFNLLTGAGTTGTITGVWNITGGTGRFAGATGSFTLNGTVDFITSTFSGTGIGTITY